MSEPVISVRGLRKSYGDLEALRGVDLEVSKGEVFAFLGPNGAGKTSTVEVLEGYRERDAGEIAVLGEDPASGSRAWRARLGIVLQSCRQQPELTVAETIAMYAGYYPAPREVGETVDLVGLGEKAGERVGKLSGGQQRRLDVAIALVGDPDLLFLDEPTTGFDPAARRQAWSVIGGLRELGKTIFLTTHYMEEAQALADRVAVIVAGAIAAQGKPDEIGGRADAAAEISFRMPGGRTAADLPPQLSDAIEFNNGVVLLRSDEPARTLNVLTGWAIDQGTELPELEVRRPSLEDVYLELTERQEQEQAR